MTDNFDDLEIPPFLRRQEPSPRKGEDAPPPPQPITEPTEQGNQYVIPGCEKKQDRKRGQLELF